MTINNYLKLKLVSLESIVDIFAAIVMSKNGKDDISSSDLSLRAILHVRVASSFLSSITQAWQVSQCQVFLLSRPLLHADQALSTLP